MNREMAAEIKFSIEISKAEAFIHTPEECKEVIEYGELEGFEGLEGDALVTEFERRFEKDYEVRCRTRECFYDLMW